MPERICYCGHGEGEHEVHADGRTLVACNDDTCECSRFRENERARIAQNPRLLGEPKP